MNEELMAQNTTLPLVRKAWTLVTPTAVTVARFQNQGKVFALVQGAVGAVEPTTFDGSIRYNPGQGEMVGTLLEMYPGIAADHLYVWTDEPGLFSISHA